MRQPIKVEAHSLIDYGFAVGRPAARARLEGPGARDRDGGDAGQGLLNALTDQPYALGRTVSFKGHARTEAVALPALVPTVALVRPFGQPAAKPFFSVLLAALVTNYALTDYDATPTR